MPDVPSWVVLGVVSAVCAALVAIYGKAGLEDVSPVAATMARAIIMAGITSVAALASGGAHELGAIDRRAGSSSVSLVSLARPRGLPTSPR